MDSLPVWMYQYFGLNATNSSHNKEGQVSSCIHPIQLISDPSLKPLNTPAQFSGLKCTYKSTIYRLRFTQLSETLYLCSAVAL